MEPFLKYVGSKRQLVPALRARLPAKFDRYFEPFCGSAALYFGLAPQRAVLADINAELVNTFRALVEDADAVIRGLRRHARLHGEAHYYRTRAAWNTQRAGWSSARRASAFIYFNKTGFNGLWRENARGEMNVPIGRYANPTICDAAVLRAAGEALRAAELVASDYRETLARVERGDLVYIDSPHDIRSKTSSFTTYAGKPFSADDQAELAEHARQLVRRRAHVVLSNADTPLVRALYRGFELEPVAVARRINSVADRRGAVDELIITGASG